LRILSFIVFFLLVSVFQSPDSYAQDEATRKRIGNSSVTLIEPQNIREKPQVDERGMTVSFLPAFRVLEEPKSFINIWKPRFTEKKAAKRFAKESGSKLKKMLELEINGKTVPMVITYVKTGYKSGHVYKALFEAENSIVVIATVFDEASIKQEEVLDAFRSIEINIETPIGNFDGAPFTMDLTPPFNFVFADSNSAFIKSYPEIDEAYAKPSMSVGYEDLFIYQGEPAIDSLETAAKHLFPIDRDNFFQSEYPDYEKVKLVSSGYVDIGPGKAYRMEVTYKDRTAIQFVWDIKGKSEFDDYLFTFVMGDTDNLTPLRNDVTKMVYSLKVKP
jgi:hypothetical protein